MQSSSPLAKLNYRWGYNADSSTTRTIPQTSSDSAAASWALGFPAATFKQPGNGGSPPNGMDVNGALTALSTGIVGLQSQGVSIFDSTFASAIGGYPSGAIVNDGSGNLWRSTADNNTTTPGASGSSWTAYFSSSLGASGYQIFPDGMIRQWGSYDSGSGGLVTITFPISFPNKAFGATAQENNALSTWTKNSPTFHGHYGLSSNSMVVVTRGLDSSSSTGWGPQQCTGDWEAWGN